MKEKGFTLVELLITLAVTVLICGAFALQGGALVALAGRLIPSGQAECARLMAFVADLLGEDLTPRSWRASDFTLPGGLKPPFASLERRVTLKDGALTVVFARAAGVSAESSWKALRGESRTLTFSSALTAAGGRWLTFADGPVCYLSSPGKKAVLVAAGNGKVPRHGPVYRLGRVTLALRGTVLTADYADGSGRQPLLHDVKVFAPQLKDGELVLEVTCGTVTRRRRFGL